MLQNIGKEYPLRKAIRKDDHDRVKVFTALRNISLEVNQGEVLGIIGRNGAGKTTLLNIIAGILSPTEGERFVKGRVVGLFNLGVGFQDALTGRENIFLNGVLLGAAEKELRENLKSVIEFSELGDFIDMPLGSYSHGMRLRLAFGIIANLNFDVLVIDEVLAVGDTLFQSKCYERLMDFKRSRKTLIVSTQDMGIIERLCDKAVLLDHGEVVFRGSPPETINRYYTLVNTEKFFVGYNKDVDCLVKDTKKWADNKADWGKRFGTKEVVIEYVRFINRFGFESNEFKSRSSLKIKVDFIAKNNVKNPHFGVAIFRKDGVYCYGPNTKFNRYKIKELKKGKGRFVLNFRSLMLAPGEYRVSVAILDREEALAFDYHNGCYMFKIKGENKDNGLLNMPFKLNLDGFFSKLIPTNQKIALPLLDNIWNKKVGIDSIRIKRLRLLDNCNEEKEVFLTNDSARFFIDFEDYTLVDKNTYLWIGIYRDDGVYCQGMIRPLRKTVSVFFPMLALLPGTYRISIGIWSQPGQKLLLCHHGVYTFKVVSNRKDHGTIYLPHKWRVEIK